MRKLLTGWIWFVIAAQGGAESARLENTKGRYFGVFREIPITDITPQGWLSEFLQRQRDGLGLHHDVSGDPFDTSLWAGPMPHPTWDRYEQTAYLVDGLYRCGLLLKDKELIGLGQANVGYVLSHPQQDGKLGPANLGPISARLIGLANIEGEIPSTQWPFAVFTRALIAHYEATRDKAVLDALTKHYHSLPENFGAAPRDVNNIEGMCWLYGETGDERLIALAERTWRNAAGSPDENTKLKSQWNLDNLKAAKAMKGHGVSVTEQSKQPALLYLVTGKKEYLDASLGAFQSMERDHELIDGVVSSDEGLHGKAAEGVHETCVISDYTWSMGYLLEATGDVKWADKIERAVLNAGLGAIDKEFKSHEYFSSPNQVIATQTSLGIRTSFGVEHLNRQAYRPEFVTQCCTGNVHRFLPNYAARMWMRDAKGGVTAVLYGSSTVKTVAGLDHVPIIITEKTDYPFEGAIELQIICNQPVEFPLYVRIPGWAQGATIFVNNEPASEKPEAGKFFKVQRRFLSGDAIQLHLPMQVRVENSMPQGISIARGPLVYSLKIKTNALPVENTRKRNPDFPAWDLASTSPWNYTLLVTAPGDLTKIIVKTQPLSSFPWTPDSAPVTLTAPAQRVLSWTLTGEGKNPPLPNPPYETAAEIEQVELIPCGATRLRITVFPAL